MGMIHPRFTPCLLTYYSFLKISTSSVNLHLENRQHILQIVEIHKNVQTQLELQAVDQKNALSRFPQLSKNWEQSTKKGSLTYFVNTFKYQEKSETRTVSCETVGLSYDTLVSKIQQRHTIFVQFPTPSKASTKLRKGTF